MSNQYGWITLSLKLQCINGLYLDPYGLIFILPTVMYANNTDLQYLAPDPIITDEEVIELVQEHQTY